MPEYSLTRADVSRRALIVGAGVGVAASLGGCSSRPGSGGSVKGTRAEFPTYQPVSDGPTPDLRGTKEGVQDVYFRYPSQRKQTVTGKIGDGADLRVLILTYSQPPTPIGQNQFWQRMNKVLGVNYRPEIVPAGDYPTKFATVVAGGDLPDVIQVPVFMNLPRLPDLARSIFTDLSDYLAGDAVKRYPNLAGIGTYAWITSRIGGRIVGVPSERPPFGNIMYSRRDIIESLGANPQPTTKAEFLELCKAVTDRSQNRYALGGYQSSNGVTFADSVTNCMFGVPNKWSLEGDKLINMFETEQWLERLSFVKETWEAGYWHPDSPSVPLAQSVNHFFSGSVVLREDGPAWWYNQAQNPGASIDALLPFSANGGTPQNFQGAGAFSFAAIRRGLPQERVEAILRVMNYCAAPFGSEEHFGMTFGVKGIDWELNAEGNAETTSQGTANRGINVDRICSAPQVLFSTKPMDDGLRRKHELQKKMVPMLVKNPMLGHYSETAQRTSSLDKALSDAATGYTLGRNSLEDVKSAVKGWRSSGDIIRKEYLASLAEG